MSSAEEEAATKQEALVGLVKAVLQRDVLFVLYHLQQLDAPALNEEDPSTKLTPLNIALSLTSDCPRRTLIVQLLLLSGAAPSQGATSLSDIDQLPEPKRASSSASISPTESETARMLVDIAIEDAESWLRQNGLDVDIAELDSAAGDVSGDQLQRSSAGNPTPSADGSISPRDSPEPPTPPPPRLLVAPSPPPTQLRGTSSAASKTVTPNGASRPPGLPMRPASPAGSNPWRFPTHGEIGARPMASLEKRRSDGSSHGAQHCPSTLGNVSPPPSRLPSEILPSRSPSKTALPPPSHPATLFVSQLSPTTSKGSLRAWLARFGAIVSVDLIPLPEGSAESASGATAVVEFAIHESAEDAKLELNGTKLEGRFSRIQSIMPAWLSDRRNESRSGFRRSSRSQSPPPPACHYEHPSPMAPPRRSVLKARSTALWRDHDSFPVHLDYSEPPSATDSRTKRPRSSSPGHSRRRRDERSPPYRENGREEEEVYKRWAREEDAAKDDSGVEEGELSEGSDSKGGHEGGASDEEEAELMVTHFGKTGAAAAIPEAGRALNFLEPDKTTLASAVPLSSIQATSPSTSSVNRLWIQSLGEEDLASLRRMWEANSRRRTSRAT